MNMAHLTNKIGSGLLCTLSLTGVAKLCSDHLHFKEFPRCVFKHLPSEKVLVSLTVESAMQPELQMLPAVFLPHIDALHNCHRNTQLPYLILTSAVSVLELNNLNYQVELFSWVKHKILLLNAPKLFSDSLSFQPPSWLQTAESYSMGPREKQTFI